MIDLVMIDLDKGPTTQWKQIRRPRRRCFPTIRLQTMNCNSLKGDRQVNSGSPRSLLCKTDTFDPRFYDFVSISAPKPPAFQPTQDSTSHNTTSSISDVRLLFWD
ncbi:hypothetical protein CC2G_012528 [Coprinopsis cinerea AmutBmut pab1-1]|nr:hypothetical protein CC2G_012528 [Coprinopsis cinerea AmutBmut pab1-1]